MSTEQSIGPRLRRARQARGLSLRSVAQELGVSASLISQVETGKSKPSVATLYAIASLLGISLDDVLGLDSSPGERTRDASASQVPEIQRSTENPAIDMENGVRWERLAGASDGPAESLLVTYAPGASSSIDGRLMHHSGVEYAYVLEGVITLQLETNIYELGPGDSLQFDSSRPHKFYNDQPVPARGVWFVVGRQSTGHLNHGIAMANERTHAPMLALQRTDTLEQL
ncbi:helix-turn-helix domain-containing protein [Arthrobacter sp. MI7-26]|uniref:helix-turn-helix domain-containing protein n=1 Tax=Arthrobacter sp. MI7-26 TaxID=2993653 RepID=UPI0022487C97|nr:helix-turn-helix domain-containing protein [Arthrobacter sp. MI7-26]MCX2750440.1 helix-turn-helix domain-containing protein [Arthrobacter sp. MI7-26]